MSSDRAQQRRENWVCGTYKVEDQTKVAREDYRKMTPSERISLIQELREIFYGTEAAASRFQRLHRDTEQGEGEVYGSRRLGAGVPRVAEADEGH